MPEGSQACPLPPKLDDVHRSVSFDLWRSWNMPREFAVLAVAAVLPLVITYAAAPPSVTGVAVMALAVALLIAATMASLAGPASVSIRLIARYTRRVGVPVEINAPPRHPVRPRAPGLV